MNLQLLQYIHCISTMKLNAKIYQVHRNGKYRSRSQTFRMTEFFSLRLFSNWSLKAKLLTIESQELNTKDRWMDWQTDMCNAILWRGIKKTFTMNLHLKYYGPIVESSQDIDVFKFLKENKFWSLSEQSMVSNKVVNQEMF